MEGFKHQSLVVLALLSVLLVNLQALDQVRALDSPQDSLPSLVIDDGDEPLASDQSNSKDKDNSPKDSAPADEANPSPAAAAAAAASEPATGKDSVAAKPADETGAPSPTTAASAVGVANSSASEEPKPISNHSDEPTGKREDAAQPTAKTELNDNNSRKHDEPKVEAEPVAKQAPQGADLEQQYKPSQPAAPEPTVVSAAGDQSASSSSPTTSSSKSEQDIKSLLENKNDAENDLASSPVTTTSAPAQSPETSTGGASSVAIDLDGPVDTNKPVDDRFHYSLGNPADKPSDDPGAKPHAVEPEEKPTLGGKKEAEQQPAADKNKEDKLKEPLEPKKIDEVQPAASGSAVAAVKPVVVKNEDSPIEAKKDKPVEESKAEEKPKVAAEPKASAETPGASPGDAALGKPADGQKESSLESKKQEAGVSTSTTTAASAQPDVKAQQPQASEKPSSAPAASNSSLSATDVALGSALGSAVGSILTKAQPAAEGKPAVATADRSELKPESSPKASAVGSTSTTVVPPPIAKVSTTSKPSRRSSTTDRWNRWSRQPPVSTSTSTVAPSTVASTGSGSSTPPTRRRLRPTRRRYRPYNRFGPFPWGGVDSYTPLGADETGLSPLDHEFGAPEVPLRPTTTGRPKRRSSTTTEVPSTKSSRGGSPSSRDELPTSSSRRAAAESSHKRRHHNHNSHDRGHEFEQGSHHGHRNHHGHRFDAGPSLFDGGYESPSFFSIGQPGSSHRPAPGFSLFNSGAGGLGSSTGSGFDLLNPFTWLDEVTKPRPSHHRPSTSPLDSSRPPFGGQPPQGGLEPSTIGSPARPPGHRPIPVEGEYGNSGPHHHGHEHHQGQGVGQRPRPPRPHGGHEDYDDYHDHHNDGHHGHHDCHHDHEHEHDHDHDHDHHHHHGQRRPVRPNREPSNERPVIGGGGGRDDYDTYPPSHGGRRPARPYQTRRDQSESSNNSNSSSRESESSRPVGGERFEGGASSGQPRPERPESSVGPRRVSSMVSPFDSLFGSLNDDFFGGLRSSFIDSPMKAAAETIRDTNTAFDALISSPKILMPSFVDPNDSVRVVKPAPQAAIEKLDQDNKNLAADSDELSEAGTSEDKDSESGFRPRQDKPSLVKLFRLVL